MLRSNRDKQQSLELVSLEELVPQDHLFRKVDKYIDFPFIDEKVKFQTIPRLAGTAEPDLKTPRFFKIFSMKLFCKRSPTGW